MIERWQRARLDMPKWIAAGLSMLLVLFVGIQLGRNELSPRDMLVVVVGIAFAVIVFAGDKGFHIGYLIWIGSFSLGYRSIQFNSNLRFHPSELMLWFLLALLFVQQGVVRRERIALWLPLWLLLFMPFWLWGWWRGIEQQRPRDLMFSELRNFLLFIPLLWTTTALLAIRVRWRTVLLVFYLVGAWIAALGLLEYLVPAVRTIVPGFFAQSEIVTAEGFMRAPFSFWGTPAATFTCMLSVAMLPSLWRWHSLGWQRLVLVLALLVQIGGIYIGGYRSMWLTTGLIMSTWSIQRFGLLRGLAVLLPVLLGYQFLPAATQERLVSLSPTAAGQYADTSATKRWDWAMYAFESVLQQPWGLGWGGAGWPHSDLLQIAANLSLPAGLLFAGAYLSVFWRLWRRQRQPALEPDQRVLGATLLMAFVGVGSLLAFQGVQVLPQFALPTWFVWMLVEVWLRQTPDQPCHYLEPLCSSYR